MSASKAVAASELLLGRVVKLSKMGLREMPCVQVRCPVNDFYEHTKMYYRKSFDFWALDSSGQAKLGDTILIRRSADTSSNSKLPIEFNLEKVIFRFGAVIDPIAKRRVLDTKFEDEVNLERDLWSSRT